MKEKKRDRFFAKTLVLIHEKGFKATTMRDMAKNLKFEVANIYNYIDSKQGFLEESLFGIQQEFLQTMDDLDNFGFNPLQKLERVIGAYIQITSKRPYEQAFLVNEWRNLKEPKLREFMERRKGYELQLEAIVRDGIEIGQFRDVEPQMAAQMILAALRWSYHIFLDKETLHIGLAIEKQLKDFICNGIVMK